MILAPTLQSAPNKVPLGLIACDSEPTKSEKKKPAFNGKSKLRFSFKEQREYQTIDGDIAELEERIAAAESDISANFSDYVKLQELTELKENLEAQLEEKMERWVYLNDLAERIQRGETV